MEVFTDLKKIFKYLPIGGKKKVGLALGSGSAKGLAHLGVIKVLEEVGVEIDCIAGTSIGALVGGLVIAMYLPVFKLAAVV